MLPRSLKEGDRWCYRAAMNRNINWHLPPLFIRISSAVQRLRLTPKVRKTGPGEHRDIVLFLRASAPTIHSPNNGNAAAAGLARSEGLLTTQLFWVLIPAQSAGLSLGQRSVASCPPWFYKGISDLPLLLLRNEMLS